MNPGPTRKHRRFTVPWVVQIKAADWGEALQLAIGNISRGGLFVRSSQPPAAGSRVEVVLELPESMVLAVEGEVVHSIPPERATEGVAAGFGLRFDERFAIDLALLEGIAASNSDGRCTFSVDASYITLPAALLEGTTVRESTTAHKLVESLAPEVEVVEGGEPAEAQTAEIISRPDEDEAPPAPPPTGFSPDLALPRRRHQTPAEESRAAPRGPSPVFGIDFGTSFSSIALVQGNQVKVLQDDEGQSSVPSVVSYPDSGTPLVGWVAREQMALSPSTTIASPKRAIGRHFDDPRLQPYLHGSPVRFERAPDGTVQVLVYGEARSMTQVCAEIFRRLAQLGEGSSGLPVRRVVLSAPVGYREEREALRRAAEGADLEVLGFVDEPVSAAMAFGLGMEGGKVIAVYDFGGGTFDFTLLRIKPRGGFEVLGEAGDAWLGGYDFDLALATYAAEQFRRKYKVELRERPVEWQRLLFLCEHAKRKLSTEREHLLQARAIVLSLRGPIHLEVPLDRELLESLCGELVERSLRAVKECLERATVGPTQIDHVVLTGGTSRSPLVRQRLQDFFGREITIPYDPELAVVSGNALYGRFLELRSEKTAAAAGG